MINFTPVRRKWNIAEIVAHNLYNEILNYQVNLPEVDDVAISVVQFNQSFTLYVDAIGYIGYNLITFSGKDTNGKPVKLIQHVQQLNFLLVVVPKAVPDIPKRTIGFGEEY